MLPELPERLGGHGGPACGPRDWAPADRRACDRGARGAGRRREFRGHRSYGRSRRAWLGGLLERPNAIPSHDTARRVLIDPEAFERGFLAWTRRAFVTGVRHGRSSRAFVTGDGECEGECEGDGVPPQIAVDGRTLRRTLDRRRGPAPLHRVGALGMSSGLVLAQRRVAGKGGGPVVLSELLAGLDVRGAPISLGAASCHPSAAGAIAARGADCPIALKGASRALHAAARAWFGPARLCDRWRAAPPRGRHGWASRSGRRAGACSWPTRRSGRGRGSSPPPGPARPGPARVLAVKTLRVVENPAPGAPQGVSREVRCDLDPLGDGRDPCRRRGSRAPGRREPPIPGQLHRVLDTGTGRGPRAGAGAGPPRRRQPRRAAPHRPHPRARRRRPLGQPEGQAQDDRSRRRLHRPPRRSGSPCASRGMTPASATETPPGASRAGGARRRRPANGPRPVVRDRGRPRAACGHGGHESIPKTSPTTLELTTTDIALEDLAFHELNARAGTAARDDEDEGVPEPAASIMERGLLNPLVVQRTGKAWGGPCRRPSPRGAASSRGRRGREGLDPAQQGPMPRAGGRRRRGDRRDARRERHAARHEPHRRVRGPRAHDGGGAQLGPAWAEARREYDWQEMRSYG